MGLQDLDRGPAGAWDTVQGFLPRDMSMQALAGPLAPEEAAGEGEAEVFVSGLGGPASGLLGRCHSPSMDLIGQLPID